ncbi:MAG: hypothetical protein M3Q03_12435 [Chloroflexota bacterium]|nr:hypothetical protein [Chloroflexota bacterium]
MGFEVHVPDDEARAIPVATCDRIDCWRPINDEAVVLFAADPDGVGTLWFKLFLACSPECAEAIGCHEGEAQAGKQVAWSTLSVAHYWLTIGTQIGLVPAERWDKMRELIGAAA